MGKAAAKAASGRRRTTSTEVEIWGLAAETECSAQSGEGKKDGDEGKEQAVTGNRKRQEDGHGSDRRREQEITAGRGTREEGNSAKKQRARQEGKG